MFKEATERILSMAAGVERRKKSLEIAIKNMQQKRDADRAKLLRDEIMLAKIRKESPFFKIRHIRKIFSEIDDVFQDSIDLSALRRSRATADHKVGQVKHWTAQSEYDDKKGQAQAVINASQASETA